MIIACMGGFCSQRANCRHYYSMSDTISERICGDEEEPERITSKSAGLEKSIEIRYAKRGVSSSESLS